MNRGKGLDRGLGVWGKEQRWRNGLQLVHLELMEMNEWWREKCLKQNTAWHGGRRLKFVLDKKSICGPNSNRKCLLCGLKTVVPGIYSRPTESEPLGKRIVTGFPRNWLHSKACHYGTSFSLPSFPSSTVPTPLHLLAGSPWKWHCGHSNLKHITTQMSQIHETKVIRISEFCHIAISMTKMQNQLHFSTFGMNDLYKKMTDPFTAAWQREFGSKFNKNQDLTLKTTVMEKNLRHE